MSWFYPEDPCHRLLSTKVKYEACVVVLTVLILVQAPVLYLPSNAGYLRSYVNDILKKIFARNPYFWFNKILVLQTLMNPSPSFSNSIGWKSRFQRFKAWPILNGYYKRAIIKRFTCLLNPILPHWLSPKKITQLNRWRRSFDFFSSRLFNG